MSKPLQNRYLEVAPTNSLLVTDCGLFPHAAYHERVRPSGIQQAIIINCMSGRGWCEMRGSKHVVSPGQVLAIPPGEPHKYGSHEREPWSIWWMHVAGQSVPGLLNSASLTAKRPLVAPKDPLRMAQLFEETLSSMERGESPVAVLRASGAAWHVLTLLADRYLGKTSEVDPVERATVYLDSQLTKPIKVPEVARIVGLSTSHLAALFRQVHGVSVLEYHSRQRMALARDLLDSTDLPIADVASRCGFEDPFYFSRQFRKYHSMSPSEYRRSPKG